MDQHLNDDVIKWKHFPRYWPFVWGIHRSPVNSPHKGQWRGALIFSLIWANGWVNNQHVGALRRHRAHYDVTLMIFSNATLQFNAVDHISSAYKLCAIIWINDGLVYGSVPRPRWVKFGFLYYISVERTIVWRWLNRTSQMRTTYEAFLV